MTPSRYQRVESIFHKAAELHPDQRRAFLNAACNGDASLLEEVESLLAAQSEAGTFLVTAPLQGAAQERLSQGTRILQYTIDSFLGAGGMGQVYEATDTRLGRKVALKFLPAAASQDAERVARFETEARAASALNHPNIVTVFDIGVAEQGHFIAMEYVAGRTLREAIGGGAILEAIPKVGMQLARAMRVAHAGGIVHRDIKPENIMIRHDGYVKVLDFGLATLFTSDESSLLGAIIGTAQYMSPEHARGEEVQSPSDVFSLGIVLYEMVCGRNPFHAASKVGAMHAILTALPDAPSKCNPDVGPVLDRLILSMLAKDPAERPTAGQVEAALATLSGENEEAPRLPFQRTAFVGRQQELGAIAEMLRDRSIRLLTLTGPGGTGKTRLAIRAAEDAWIAHKGSVCFVDLAPITEPALVIAAIARAIGVHESPGQDLMSAVCSHINAQEATLIVLDNFEHVVTAAHYVAELLNRCVPVRFLVTSRMPLRLYGEREYRVDPLPLPAADASTADLKQFASIALFVQRAIAVRPDFRLTDENARYVAAICRRLDGLPLAIELAASRIKLLPPEAMLARMERSLDLLTGGSRDQPARQRTLRAAIDWSFELLTPAERTLFSRLSVFMGGCTLESVEAVCNTREDLEVDVIEGISSLVDHGLVRQANSNGEPRFLMLETIREYAHDRLVACGELVETQRAHGAYFVVFAEDLAAMDLEAQKMRIADMENEYANVRVALSRLVTAGNTEWALRLAGAPIWFWEHTERFSEGRDAIEAALNMDRARDASAPRGRAAYAAATLCYRLGNYACAVKHQADALPSFRRIGDPKGVASVLISMAFTKQALGRSAEAKEHMEECVSIWRELGDDVAVDYSLSNLARIAEGAGDYAGAREILEPLVERFRARGDRRATASALSSLGDVATAEGDLIGAEAYHAESLGIFNELNDSPGLARVYADLGNLAQRAGRENEATWHFRDSLQKAVDAKRRTSVVRALAGMAQCALSQAKPHRALSLAGAALSVLHTVATSTDLKMRKSIQETLDRCRAQVAFASYQRELTRCRRFTFDQAVAVGMDLG